MRYLAALTVIIVVSFSIPAYSQDIEISCDTSPAVASLEVPEPATRFLHVVCTKFGHVINPTVGWFWTSPGSYGPHFYPAQMVRTNPKEVDNEIYFEDIVVIELAGESAMVKWSEIFAGMFDESEDGPPDRALKVVAISSMGQSHTIYIFPNKFGYGCSPTCKKDNVFLMVSETNEDVDW